MKTIIYKCAAFALSFLAFIFFISSCVVSSGRGEFQNEEKLSLTDALGRDVSVKKHPKRVASLLGSYSDVWLLAGGELCASAEDAWEDFGLELNGAKNIGGAHSPSLELLLSASPEIVIASSSTASHVELLDTLEAVGITVIYFDVDNFEDYLGMLDVCTDITGRKDLYEKNGLLLKEEIDRIKDNYTRQNLTEKEHTVLLLRASSTALKAKGSKGTILGEMLADMGCINIADSDSSLLENLSIESVIMNDPQHIFVVTMGNDSEAANALLKKTMKENPAWQTLRAIKEERLYVMDKALFNLKPNARFAEAYQKLYETLVGI